MVIIILFIILGIFGIVFIIGCVNVLYSCSHNTENFITENTCNIILDIKEIHSSQIQIEKQLTELNS